MLYSFQCSHVALYLKSLGTPGLAYKFHLFIYLCPEERFFPLSVPQTLPVCQISSF